jgi:DNA-binding SARP family transcriptional activator
MSRRVAGRGAQSVDIRLSGPLEVDADDGTGVMLAGPRLRALLTALALRCGEPVTDDALIDAVWGNDPSASRGSGCLSTIFRGVAE